MYPQKMLAKCPLAKCPLAKCPLTKRPLAKYPLAICPDTYWRLNYDVAFICLMLLMMYVYATECQLWLVV